MKKEEEGKDLGKELKDKDIRRKKAFMNIKPPSSFISLAGNNSFCDRFFTQKNISIVTDDTTGTESGNGELVYDFSRVNNFDSEAFGKIIDILTQLRAAEEDRSILVQNNTVLREEILNQLKNEVLKVRHKLTNNQIKNLEVISSNNFDKDTLAEMLKSLLESSKKKSADEKAEFTDTEFARRPKLVTLENVSRNYRSVLERVNYYEKIIDRVLSHVTRKVKEADDETPELVLKEKAAKSKKTVLKKKSVKDVFDKVSKIQDVKILEEINKFYEENLINKMGVLPRIINLQSKVSEMNILTKVGTFVENIVQKSVPKFITSETELVNKVIKKTNFEELREEIIESQKQYIEDKSFQDRNISRLYSEVRKIYNTKTLNKNVTEILKHFDYKKVNLEEHVKKNLLKLTTKKDVLNRFKNIYSDAIENVTLTKSEDRTELVNRTGTVTEVNEEERAALKDVVNLRRSGIVLNKRFTENIHQNNVLMDDIRLRKKKIKNIHSNLEKISDVFAEDENLENNIIYNELITKDHLTKSDVENYLERIKHTSIKEAKSRTQKNRIKKLTESIWQNNVLTKDIRLNRYNIRDIYSNLEKINNVFAEDKNFVNNIISTELVTKKNLTKSDIENYLEKVKRENLTESRSKVYRGKVKEITDEVKEQLTKEIFDIHEKEIHNKFKAVAHKERLNLLKTSGIKPIVSIQTPGKDKVEVWNKEDVYNFIPIHVKENILDERIKENVVTHDISKFLPDRILRNRKFKIHKKDIYKNITKQHIDKYVEKSYDLQKEYFVNRQDNIDRQVQHDHIDQGYMVYKQEIHYPEESGLGEDVKKRDATSSNREGRITMRKKAEKKPAVDVKKIEKDIMSKTMSKKDIMDLVESYMKDIDVETISRSVMDRMDERVKFDRQRSGAF